MDDYSFTSFFLADGYQPSNGNTSKVTLQELKKITDLCKYDVLKNCVNNGLNFYDEKINFIPKLVDTNQDGGINKPVYEYDANETHLNHLNGFFRITGWNGHAVGLYIENIRTTIYKFYLFNVGAESNKSIKIKEKTWIPAVSVYQIDISNDLQKEMFYRLISIPTYKSEKTEQKTNYINNIAVEVINNFVDIRETLKSFMIEEKINLNGDYNFADREVKVIGGQIYMRPQISGTCTFHATLIFLVWWFLKNKPEDVNELDRILIESMKKRLENIKLIFDKKEFNLNTINLSMSLCMKYQLFVKENNSPFRKEFIEQMERMGLHDINKNIKAFYDLKYDINFQEIDYSIQTIKRNNFVEINFIDQFFYYLTNNRFDDDDIQLQINLLQTIYNFFDKPDNELKLKSDGGQLTKDEIINLIRLLFYSDNSIDSNEYEDLLNIQKNKNIFSTSLFGTKYLVLILIVYLLSLYLEDFSKFEISNDDESNYEIFKHQNGYYNFYLGKYSKQFEIFCKIIYFLNKTKNYNKIIDEQKKSQKIYNFKIDEIDFIYDQKEPLKISKKNVKKDLKLILSTSPYVYYLYFFIFDNDIESFLFGTLVNFNENIISELKKIEYKDIKKGSNYLKFFKESNNNRINDCGNIDIRGYDDYFFFNYEETILSLINSKNINVILEVLNIPAFDNNLLWK